VIVSEGGRKEKVWSSGGRLVQRHGAVMDITYDSGMPIRFANENRTQ